MKQKALIFTLLLSLTLTYSLLTYSQDKKRDQIIKGCVEIKNLFITRKNYLQSSVLNKKQQMSDIKSSIEEFHLTNSQNILSVKDRENINSFYEEFDILILEREDFISKIDALLLLDCESDKRSYFVKLSIFNNNYKNHVRKEIRLIEDFDKDIYEKLKELKK